MHNIVDKKIINKYIYLSIYIINIDKIILNVCLHIIKDIKIDIILKNSILELF